MSTVKRWWRSQHPTRYQNCYSRKNRRKTIDVLNIFEEDRGRGTEPPLGSRNKVPPLVAKALPPPRTFFLVLTSSPIGLPWNPIPDNSWPCKPLCCGWSYEVKIQKFCFTPFQSNLKIGSKTAYGRDIAENGSKKNPIHFGTKKNLKSYFQFNFLNSVTLHDCNVQKSTLKF